MSSMSLQGTLQPPLSSLEPLGEKGSCKLLCIPNICPIFFLFFLSSSFTLAMLSDSLIMSSLLKCVPWVASLYSLRQWASPLLVFLWPFWACDPQLGAFLQGSLYFLAFPVSLDFLPVLPFSQAVAALSTLAASPHLLPLPAFLTALCLQEKNLLLTVPPPVALYHFPPVLALKALLPSHSRVHPCPDFYFSVMGAEMCGSRGRVVGENREDT